MPLSDLPDDTPLLLVYVPDKDGFTDLVATAFPSRASADAFDYRVEPNVAQIPPAWSDDWLVIKKSDLAPLALEDKPFVHLHLKFGEHGEKGSLWGLVRWSEEDLGFSLLLRSYHLHGIDAGIAPPEFATDPPLCLGVERVPEIREHLFLIGDGGGTKRFRYDHQAHTLMLAREHDETLTFKYRSRERPATNYNEAYPELIDDDLSAHCGDEKCVQHGTIATHIGHFKHYGEPLVGDDYRRNTDRIVFTRMYLPGSYDLEGWRAVFRTKGDDDPIVEARGGWNDAAHMRALGYLGWVATNAPGRVLEYAIVSHAYVQGPLNLGGATPVPPDFDGREDILDAFAPGAAFWVTGCNADGGTLPHERASRANCTEGGDAWDGYALVQRQKLASVEGTIRAYLRLTRAATEMLLPLPDGQARADERFGRGDARPWQRPGPDEGELDERDPESGNRDGDAIRTIAGFRAQEEAIRTWARRGEHATAEEHASAVEAFLWILANVTWERMLTLSVSGRTIAEWIERATRATAPDVHYAAAFAKLARGRDIRAFGGVPGVDGQHLSVDIDLPGGRTHKGHISAFLRTTWSNSNIPWLLLFFRRFGLVTDHPLWYLDYSKVSAESFVFDHQSLTPWPMPEMPEAVSQMVWSRP
jgi:hypothetical protein